MQESESKPLLQNQPQSAFTPTSITTTTMTTKINPPQTIPFIPMVPPLSSTFSPPMIPSVTSALVNNLINNNPAPVASSAFSSPSNITTNAQHSEPKTTSAVIETNANVVQETTPVASQLFNADITTQNTLQNFIHSEQNQTTIQPESNLASPQKQAAAEVNQSFVNTESKYFLK